MAGAPQPAAHFRAHARRRVALVGTVRDPGRSGTLRVSVRDLGLGGAGIEWEARAAASFGQIAQGSRVQLEIMAPTLWDPLLLDGTVAWFHVGAFRASTRAGIAFEHKESATAIAVLQLLSAQAYL